MQYALGDYEGALKHFIEADLQGLTEKSLAPRSIRIIAESFAIKGIIFMVDVSRVLNLF